jgi:hypothetical protein
VGTYLSGGKKSSHAKPRKTTNNASFDELSQAVVSAGGDISNKLPAIYKV